MCVGNGRSAVHGVPAVALKAFAAAALLVLAGAGELRAETQSSSFESGYEAYQRGEFTAARDIWEPLAESGDPRAQYNLGLMHAEGRGVRQDRAEAVKWWRRAAEGGNVRAMHNLALAYVAGVPDGETGMPVQDYRIAVRWLKRAADKGFANSIFFLGTMYRDGLGVQQDKARAAALFVKSAEQGYVRAQYHLAEAYLEGAGVERSPDKSLQWLRMAAEGGSSRAQYRMAARYAGGGGTEPNLVEALKWCLLAARQGNEKARDSLDDLMLRASLQELQEATKRARELEMPQRGNSVR